ncbi:AMP-binding protein [Streptacidiphilus jiangxiensis]|uniref:Acyl-CoA synthetase (AMP-forming)/AMP-acid ligase II n=1 Tax=Streptacidiphilus jiangxiensis TaxID=235985 RepID=A0A1H7KYE0_STRJI|nr:AMP-binding protein [Streptacidiphilus jiangxiensis]SEK91125.1 Acyl-CoA synthetase (AMP-forming)/AMP-acid ligase II [Streptacidiphilus jiangxiensis]
MSVTAEAAALPPWSVDPADAGNPSPALGDLLAAPARRWPDRDAVNDGEASYTFAQLEQGARTVAARLTERGVAAGDRVVVLTQKRAVMPILALAVWKCGAVYVPLDAGEPAGRLEGLLTRLRPTLVVALDDRDPLAPADRWLGGTELAEVLAGPAATHTTVPHPPEQAAYIIFASGPTGEPQGVENSAAALLAYFGRHNQVLRFTPESRVLSLSPFQVDVSFEDTLLPLSVGAFVFQFRNLPAGAVVRAVLSRERITHLIAVSMLLAMITGDGRQLTRAKLPDLEFVMTGAQVCDPEVLGSWARQLPDVRVVQAFGPPEATVFGLNLEIGPDLPERGDAVGPIGRPFDGLRVALVQDGVEIRQPGAEGELWVGGDQVMLGYFDQPEETARVVVELDGTRYFRTGDICSLDDAGALVLRRHGDADIRWLAGRRTHLSEIRRAAQSFPGVARTLVAEFPRNRRDTLALVVLPEEGQAPQAPADLDAHLRGLLPDYMRPTVLAWAPAAAAAPTVPDGDERLVEQLTAAAQQSNSPYFAVSADGAVETID